jgi:hypothetical protein
MGNRSLYVIDGPTNLKWQHAIKPGQGERVSLTFRRKS